MGRWHCKNIFNSIKSDVSQPNLYQQAGSTTAKPGHPNADDEEKDLKIFYENFSSSRCSRNKKNPEVDIDGQPENQECKVSQATREVLPLPRLGDCRLSRLNLPLLSFDISSSAGIKGL